MKNTKNIIVIGMLGVVAACAQKPEAVAPAYVTPTLYKNFTCSQLAEEHGRLTHAYAVAAGQQNQARSNDIAGVVLLGLPVSTLSGGNVAHQIANIKGQQEAVRSTMIRKNCRSVPKS